MLIFKKNKLFNSEIVNLFFKFSIGSWGAAALSFFTTPIVTALLIPEEFGKASMFTLVFSLFSQVILLGTDQSFVRKFYSKEFEDNRTSLLKNCLIGPLVFCIFSIFIILIFWRKISWILIQEEQISICIILSISLIFGILERYANLILRMYKKGFIFSVLRLLASVITFLVVVIYCKFVERSFYAILYSTLVPLVIISNIGIFIERDLWFGKARLDKVSLKLLLKYGIPFVPTFIIGWVFEGMDKLALRKYGTFFDIGLFAAALKIIGLLSILQLTFSTLWTPLAFEAFENKSEDSKIMFKKAFNYISFLLLSCGLCLIGLKNIIILFFDKLYYEANTLIPFLLLVPIMYSLSEITVGGINFKNKTYLHFVISVICALLNGIGNYFLVPKFGAKGAAISTGIAYIMFFYLRTIFSNRLFFIDFGLKRITFCIILFCMNAYIHSFYETTIYVLGFTSIIQLIYIYAFLEEIKHLLSILKIKFKLS